MIVLNHNMLDGKIVLLTGAGGGIGFEAAKAFVELGAKVLIAEVDQEKGEQATTYEPLFCLALLTGLRQGELCALTWDDIDFEAKTLSVNKTLVYSKNIGEESASYKFNPPKTQKGNRTIPLTNEAIVVLRKQKAQCEWLKSQIGTRDNLTPVKGFENLVFYTRMTTPVCERSIVAAIKAALRRINKNRAEDEPEFAYFTPHTLRHTFATRCFESGMQPKTLQELLGHNSLEMTMGLYTHVIEEMKQREVEKITLTGLSPIGVKLALKTGEKKLLSRKSP